jgi:hypothetical protein
MRLKQIDEDLFLLSGKRRHIGFAERITSRLLAIYSILDARVLSYLMRDMVRKNSELDHVWFSGIAFSVLWDIVSKISDGHRYTKIVFTHESLYDVDPDEVRLAPFQELPALKRGDGDRGQIEERRLASFRLADRVSIVGAKLSEFQRIYEPLYAKRRTIELTPFTTGFPSRVNSHGI